MSNTFILDACALVALLKNEEGADAVAATYKQAGYFTDSRTSKSYLQNIACGFNCIGADFTAGWRTHYL